MSTMQLLGEEQQTEALQASLRAHDVTDFDVAVVLGSGLGAFAERLEGARTIAYEDLEGMPASTVAGHAGQLVLGTLRSDVGTPKERSVRVLTQQGRVHLYEGLSAYAVTRAVRSFCALGCRSVLLTNAAGGLHADWKPGTLMALNDHINLQHASPLSAEQRSSGSPYDPELIQLLSSAAKNCDVDLKQGVYAALLGPTYETPAEIRMLRWMGADAVGMSTAAEATAAAAAGARVAAVSLITNPAAGITGEKLNHEEVVEAGRQAAERFGNLLEESLLSL